MLMEALSLVGQKEFFCLPFYFKMHDKVEGRRGGEFLLAQGHRPAEVAAPGELWNPVRAAAVSLAPQHSPAGGQPVGCGHCLGGQVILVLGPHGGKVPPQPLFYGHIPVP